MSAKRTITSWRRLANTLLLSLGLAMASKASAAPEMPADTVQRASYIVQAQDLRSARYAVIRAGGAITNDLRARHAVNAILTEAQRQQVAAEPGVKVLENPAVAAIKP